MITVHHLNNSRSQRVLWMLEELEQPYEIRKYKRDSETMLAPASLKKVHPLGKAPIITDGDLTIAESGAIVDYLAQTYGKDSMVPRPGTQAWIDYTYWLHYAEGSLMPPLVMRLVFEKVKTSPMPFFVKPIARSIANKTIEVFIGPQIHTHMDFVEAHLAEHNWFLGEELSAADFQMGFPLEAAVAKGLVSRKKQPNIVAYVERIHQRPAYKRALERGGEYDFA